MREYIRSRRRLWAFGGVCLGVGLSGLDVFFAIVTYIPQFRVRNDFRLMYGAAEVTVQHGYGHLYDMGAQASAVQGLGGGFYWQPFLNPPPLVWLVTPLTALPFNVAIVVWSALIAGALVLAWYLAAPGDRFERAALGAMWVGVFPVAFGLLVGQPVAFVALAVAACWWLVQRDRPGLAGLALSAIALKPQLAILVPLCLAVTGHARVFGAWLAASIFIGLLSLALLGHDGLARYRDALAVASGWQITRTYAVSGLIGTGPQLFVAQALAVAGALAAAWRWRGSRVEVPIAAGIAGSLLFTPYAGFQDFAMLVVAGWLVMRTPMRAWQVALLVAGYGLLEFVLVLPPALILLTEVLFLAGLVRHAPTRPAPRPSRTPAPAPV